MPRSHEVRHRAFGTTVLRRDHRFPRATHGPKLLETVEGVIRRGRGDDALSCRLRLPLPTIEVVTACEIALHPGEIAGKRRFKDLRLPETFRIHVRG